MVDTLHAKNIHFMVSVWSKFDKNTSFYADMYKHGTFLKGRYIMIHGVKAPVKCFTNFQKLTLILT